MDNATIIKMLKSMKIKGENDLKYLDTNKESDRYERGLIKGQIILIDLLLYNCIEVKK